MSRYAQSQASQARTSFPPPLLPEFSSPTFSPYGQYNPKSVTQAAWAARNAPPKPKPSGPLVQMDVHREPSLRAAAQRCPVSRPAVTWARYSCLVLRLGQLLAAMGILAAMLLMRGVDDLTGWMCRIPPAVVTVHAVYAIYHLSGSYRLKTPGSSKMYHLVASTLDVGTLTAYAGIGVAAWRQHAAADGDGMTWHTVFADAATDAKMVLTVFVLVCAAGGLTAITLALSLYLVHAMRLLASLPPDANPFVDDDDPRLATVEPEPGKRWSASTDASAASSTAPFLPAEKRAMPFAVTRAARPDRPYSYASSEDAGAPGEPAQSYTPPPPSPPPPPPRGGKYSYHTLSLDEADLVTGQRDPRRDDVLGGGYDPDPFADQPGADDPDARTPSLKRGSRIARPPSLYQPQSGSLASDSGNGRDSGYPYGAGPPVPESQRSSVVSHKGWASAGAVQGYSKAALLAGGAGAGARLRKVSGEAN